MPARSIPEGRLLSELLPEAPLSQVRVTGLALDSREVCAGDLFLACRGGVCDGRDFIAEALAKGAAAVLAEAPFHAGAACTAPVLSVPGLRSRLGAIADAFYDAPSAALHLTAITGTDGKTSFCHLYSSALSLLGQPCGSLGSFGCRLGGTVLEKTRHTTPDAPVLHRLLARLREQGAAAAALELSSHALDQHRAAGLRLDTAVLSCLGRDHLDYHGSPAAYREAKARLFSFPGLARAVLNADDAFGQQLAAARAGDMEVVTYGLEAGAAVRGLDAHFDEQGIAARVESPWGTGTLRSPLLGPFNLYNLLAAAAALGAEGHPLAEVLAALAAVPAPPGRLQPVPNQAGLQVLVDYAHTPQALEQALGTLRPLCRGRLWCVFGCGGERDTGKRPLMGAVAERLADCVVLTSDNPRGESPAAILQQIQAGLSTPQAARVEPDRGAAIAAALREAAAGDWILIAGKGDEDTQELGSERLPFDDATAARLVLRSLEGGE